jgi:methanethiol S-methyltransferase
MTTVARAWAWLGGAIFAGSLGICAWWYFVTLGRAQPAAEPAAINLIGDALLVAVFAAHHSLFARESIKRRLSFIPADLRRSVYVWVASVLLILVIVLWQPVGGDLYEASGRRAVLHIAVQALGLWLIARAVAGLDPFDLAGIRDATHQAGRESLQIDGPYRVVRHPLYLGWVLLFFGIPHMTGDRLAFAALTSLYLVVAIPFEERSLVRCFGDQYRRYRARVRWRLIPFVY